MWCFLLKNLSEARILDLPPKRDNGHPPTFLLLSLACEQNGTTPSESVVEVFSWYSNHMEIVLLTNKNWATAINTLLLFLKCALQGFYV